MGLPRIPAIATLQRFDQWVAWDYVWKTEKQKYDKPPLNARTGSFARHSDPATWSTYEARLQEQKPTTFPDVGFVLGPDDGLTGLDLDDCRNDATGVLAPWAAEIVALAETYAEVSPSGQGIRLFALGKVEQATKYDPAKVEIYGKQRYLTITGRHINGTPIAIQPAPKTIAALLSRVQTFREQTASAKAIAHDQHSRPAQRSGKIAEALRDPFFRSVNSAALECAFVVGAGVVRHRRQVSVRHAGLSRQLRPPSAATSKRTSPSPRRELRTGVCGTWATLVTAAGRPSIW